MVLSSKPLAVQEPPEPDKPLKELSPASKKTNDSLQTSKAKEIASEVSPRCFRYKVHSIILNGVYGLQPKHEHQQHDTAIRVFGWLDQSRPLTRSYPNSERHQEVRTAAHQQETEGEQIPKSQLKRTP